MIESSTNREFFNYKLHMSFLTTLFILAVATVTSNAIKCLAAVRATEATKHPKDTPLRVRAGKATEAILPTLPTGPRARVRISTTLPLKDSLNPLKPRPTSVPRKRISPPLGMAEATEATKRTKRTRLRACARKVTEAKLLTLLTGPRARVTISSVDRGRMTL